MTKRELILDLFWNGLLPWVAFSYLQDHRHWTEYQALLTVTVIPAVFALWALIWQRRLDAVACISLVSIVISLAMTATSADSRMLQIRESYLTGLFGLLFVISALVGRPILWWMTLWSIKEDDRRQQLLDARQDPPRWRLFNLMTWGWGLSLLLEVALKLWMIYTLPVATVLWLGPVSLYGVTGLTVLWTIWLVRRARRAAATPPECR